jgi:uncharacterized protein
VTGSRKILPLQLSVSTTMNETLKASVRDTRRWLERAVIGLNLCPFAKAVHVKDQVHYAVSVASQASEVLDDLRHELDSLIALDSTVRETTLLIVPGCLHDFLDFNDFMAQAVRLVRKHRLEGVIQLASFHPAFQFAGSDADDIANFTNRSPYPTIHLLREESIDRAVAAIAQPEAIYDANIETLRRLGRRGWDDLDVGPSA